MDFYRKILPNLRYHEAISSDINIIQFLEQTSGLFSDCTIIDTINFYDISVSERNESNLYRFNGKINFFYTFNLIGFGALGNVSDVALNQCLVTDENVIMNAIENVFQLPFAITNTIIIDDIPLDDFDEYIAAPAIAENLETFSVEININEANSILPPLLNGWWLHSDVIPLGLNVGAVKIRFPHSLNINYISDFEVLDDIGDRIFERYIEMINEHIAENIVLIANNIDGDCVIDFTSDYNVFIDGPALNNDGQDLLITVTQEISLDVDESIGWVNNPPKDSDISFISYDGDYPFAEKWINGYEYNRNWIMQMTYPSSILRNKPWRENGEYCYENGLLIESIEQVSIDGGRRIVVCTCSNHNLNANDYVYINNSELRNTYLVRKLGDSDGERVEDCFICGTPLKGLPSSASTYTFNGTIKRIVGNTSHNINRYGFAQNIDFVFSIHYDTFTGNTYVGEYCGEKHHPKWQYNEGEYYTIPQTPKWWSNWDRDRNFLAFYVADGHGLLRGDYVEIVNANDCLKINGLHKIKYLGIPYAFNDGECVLSGEDYFFNDKIFIIDLDVNLSDCPINPKDLIWRKINGCASEYYLREFKIISDENDYEIFKNGYEKTIYDDINQQFQFNKTFDFTGEVDYLNRPLTELHIGFIKRPGVEPFNWGVVDGELDFRICGKNGRTPLAKYEGISNNLSYPFNYEDDGNEFVEAIWRLSGDTTNKFKELGSKYIGDLIEYNVCDLSETVISPIMHRFNLSERDFLGVDEGRTIEINLEDKNINIDFVGNSVINYTFDYEVEDEGAILSSIQIFGAYSDAEEVEILLNIDIDGLNVLNENKTINFTENINNVTISEFIGNQVFIGQIISIRIEVLSLIPQDNALFFSGQMLLANRIRTYPYQEGFKYKPFHRIEIKSLSEYIEYGDTSVDIKQEIPFWAECHLNNYLWRDVLDQGTYKLEERFADYPFANGCHYIYKNFNLFLQRQCISSDFEDSCTLDYDRFKFKDAIDEC